ncbi:BolA protein family transcriptional regulator [Idiomarina aquatica]|uniref:BolA protein family transcriptional regulator n=1 Tax=Idiomarina aquatica TaxID=1327752 RepID=A0A4R6PKG3_9GAMM|nr:BolA/IbaG family iron-sulfur metabolism protein [Idiomarina aquatica]TDP38914.1 BolA protein family transcriptional regulator [Idiomarina aquatica]
MKMREQIEQKLQQQFAPLHLQVDDESYMHASGREAQSHFKVTMVSEAFSDKRLLQRHRAINKVLAEELQQIHALALHTYTPDEWQGQAPDSPNCMGGGR